MKNSIINQEKTKQFSNTIANKIKNGFVIIEKNNKIPFTVLEKEGVKVNHTFNFVASCATFGIWLLPWLYLSQVASKTKTILIAIDEDGDVFEQNCYVG
jgi:hypothetical protein